MNVGSFRIDHDYLPFGRLSSETIEQAREVLREIKWVFTQHMDQIRQLLF